MITLCILWGVSSALVVLCSHQILSLQKLFFCVETFSPCYLSEKFHHSHSIEKKLCDNIFIYAMKCVSGGCAEQQVVRLGAKNICLRETKHQSPWLWWGAAGDQTIISAGSLFVSSSGPRPVGGTLASPSPVRCTLLIFVKLRQGSGKDWQGMAVKAKGLKA